MLSETLRLMKEVDWFAAAAYLNHQPDQLASLELYNKLIKHLYYENKNMPAVVAMARSAIQFGLAAGEALEASDREQATKLLERTRAVSYNLASYTWPGWDEPGIEIGVGDLAQGLDAANVTLRLTEAFDMGALRLSRSHWMLGAHLMAADMLSEAALSFNNAAILAEEAGAQAEVLLARGYSAIVGLMLTTADQAAANQFEEVKIDLVQKEYGEIFIGQLDTTRRVFLQ